MFIFLCKKNSLVTLFLYKNQRFVIWLMNKRRFNVNFTLLLPPVLETFVICLTTVQCRHKSL